MCVTVIWGSIYLSKSASTGMVKWYKKSMLPTFLLLLLAQIPKTPNRFRHIITVLAIRPPQHHRVRNITVSAPTPGLLGLPRETRLQIIRNDIASVDKAPVFEEVINDRVAYNSAFETSDIYVPRAEATPVFHGSGLLLTSKQLNDETRYALQAMRENEMKGFEFVLDVMYVSGPRAAAERG